MTHLLAHPYDATDAGTGDTADSEHAWRVLRPHLASIVRAVITVVGVPIGTRYAVTDDGQYVHPVLVVTDSLGRSVALSGMPGGYSGTGPQAAARLLSETGLLHHSVALDTVSRIAAPTAFVRAAAGLPEQAVCAAAAPPFGPLLQRVVDASRRVG